MGDIVSVEPQKLGVAVPFRSEVPVTAFEKFQEVKKDIEDAKRIFSSPEDKPGIAQVVEDIFYPEKDFPNEAKIEAFRQGYELISEPQEQEINLEVAKTLLDIIISQRENPSIRIRLAAVVSRDLQDDLFQPTTKKQQLHDPFREKGKQTIEEHRARSAKKAVFEHIAAGQDSEDPVQKRYQAWARQLLNPGLTLQVFNKLYDWDASVDMTPRIIEEITEETDEGEDIPLQGAISAAGLIRLRPPYLPTFEKMVAYEKANDRPLPFFLVWKQGAYFISIEFPLEFTQQACDDWLKFRSGDMTREEVFERAEGRMDAFIAQMTPEQRKEMEKVGKTHNLHIRFSTKRSGIEPDSVRELPPIDIPQETKEEQKAA